VSLDDELRGRMKTAVDAFKVRFAKDVSTRAAQIAEQDAATSATNGKREPAQETK